MEENRKTLGEHLTEKLGVRCIPAEKDDPKPGAEYMLKAFGEVKKTIAVTFAVNGITKKVLENIDIHDIPSEVTQRKIERETKNYYLRQDYKFLGKNRSPDFLEFERGEALMGVCISHFPHTEGCNPEFYALTVQELTKDRGFFKQN